MKKKKGRRNRMESKKRERNGWVRIEGETMEICKRGVEDRIRVLGLALQWICRHFWPLVLA